MTDSVLHSSVAALPPAFRMVAALSLPDSALDIPVLCREVDDWQAVIRLARRHGVVALSHQRLASLEPELVPAGVVEQIKELREEELQRNLLLMSELLSVTAALAKAGVDSWAFKGPVLSQLIFGSAMMRAPGDLDLLIEPEALLVAQRVLEGLGYRRRSPGIPIDQRNLALIQRLRCDAEYAHPERKLIVELHWRWQRNPWLMRFDAQRVRDGTSLILSGRQLATPDPQEQFIYLCVHGCRHSWSRFKWLADMAWWLRQPSLRSDWEALAGRARELGAYNSLCATLELLNRFGIQSPTFGKSSEPATAMADDCLRDWSRPAPPPVTAFAELVRGVRMEWRMSDSWQARLWGILWGRLMRPNDGDMAMLPLPARAAGLYFLLRPIFWLLRRAGIKPLSRGVSSPP